MKRSAIKVQRPPQDCPAPPRRLGRSNWLPKVATQIGPEYTLRPRPAAVAAVAPARELVAVPKFSYVRDERLRYMCRSMPCACCGASGEQAGVTWAHSNQAIHGKGLSEKASDVYVAAMCAWCHRELDQGGGEDQERKVARWTAAWRKTIGVAITSGLWPLDIPLPNGWRP